jgi:hypothetical protein
VKVLILCCHGVYHRGKFYAERPQERIVYENHIRNSFALLREKRFDLLIISGGYTKDQEEKSEARGYLDWADDLGLERSGVKILLEEFARSSVENLLFSVCRFYQYYGCFPEEIGAYTLTWKDRWFKDVIAKALRLPNFQVIRSETEEKALKGIGGAVLPNSQEVAEKNKPDPLERLSFEKVRQRDPWKKGNPYEIIPDFQEMFEVLNQAGREKNSSLSLNFKFPW